MIRKIWEGKITHTADGGCLGRLRRRRTWGACDKPRGGGYQPLIRGFPNGETWFADKANHRAPNLYARGIPAEVKHFSKRRKRKQSFIPPVAASEKGRA